MSATVAALPVAAAMVAATGGLLGSAHCVGMCGPFVGFAGLGAQGAMRPARAAVERQLSYHLGRFTTYAAMGVLAGLFGAAVMRVGAVLDVQRALAWLMGLTLVGIGLAQVVGWRLDAPGGEVRGRFAGRIIRIAREGGGRLGPYLLGLGSTLLPCGFLYSFAFAAAATGTLAGALATMLGFWAGTLPALVVTAWLARWAGSGIFRHSHRVLGAVLIALGLLGVSGKWQVIPAAPPAGELAPPPACCDHAAP